MRVELGKSIPAPEIIRAFKQASTFQDSREERWDSQEIVTNHQYRDGLIVPESVGVIASPSYLRKKYLIAGPKFWAKKVASTGWGQPSEPTFNIKLQPVHIGQSYETVEVTYSHRAKFVEDTYSEETSNPEGPNFDYVSPYLKRILNNFLLNIQ